MSTPTPPTPAPAAPAAPPAAPAPPTAPPTPAPPAPAPAPAAPEPHDVASLPQWAQRIISDTRAEAASHRTAKTAAEQAKQDALDAIAKAAGLKTDDADPTKLAEQLTAERAATRQARVEAAVARAAGTHSGNPDALLDSMTFRKALEGLDPAAADFATQLGEAIKAAVAANPALSVAPAGPARGGADLSGGGGNEPRQLTEDDLKNMTPEQIVKAQDEGLLRNLLGG